MSQHNPTYLDDTIVFKKITIITHEFEEITFYVVNV